MLPPATAPRVLATPLARRLARELGVPLSAVRGTGPRGRVHAPDVRAAAQAYRVVPTRRPGAARPPTDFEADHAARWVAAKQVPHFYLTTEAEASALWALRDRVSASVTELLFVALARTLHLHPEANRVWSEGEIVQQERVDLGLAVHTADGLLTPRVRDVGTATVSQVCARLRGVRERAAAGTLTGADLGGGVSALSNLGAGVASAGSAVIALGHSSAFSVGGLRQVFRPGAQGQPVLRCELSLTMSCDHRLFDGVAGLAVLQTFRRQLQSPASLLA